MNKGRRLRYQVAASLDGFIADANGGYDWIVHDPAIDFTALYAQFDTAVMGRKTYDLARTQGDGSIPGMQVFRSLLDAGLVDTVEIAVMPVLLGSGVPLLPAGSPAKLTLADRKVLPASGIVVLAYSVEGSEARPPRIEYVKEAQDENP